MSGGNKHYGLDDGYVTRDMSVLGINERGGGQNVGMSSGGGALNEYGSSGTGTGASHGTGHQSSGVHFSEGTGGTGGGREYSSIQSELGPAGVGPDSSRGHEYASGGMGGHGYETGSVGSGSAGGLQTGAGTGIDVVWSACMGCGAFTACSSWAWCQAWCGSQPAHCALLLLGF